MTDMAMNLRLDPERSEMLAEEARRMGRSQAEIIRDAIDAYLAHSEHFRARRERASLIDAGLLVPASGPYRRTTPYLRIPGELDREDRV
ncbi:MAG: CopG family ribbon-helix-helix protein [Jiangellaceae bacterium]